MKKGAFSGLLYREWVLMKKPLVLSLLWACTTTLLVFLLVVSFQRGNLALLDGAVKAAIFGDFAFLVKALPALSVCLLVTVPGETAGFDARAPWARFRRAAPAGCLRLALAKYTVIGALTLLAAAGALAVTALMCRVMGTAFTTGDAAAAMVLLSISVIFCVAIQVPASFFPSPDQAGLTSLALMTVCLLPVAAANRDVLFSGSLTGAGHLSLLAERIAGALPLVPLVILAALGLGLLATTLIYKRREP